MNLRDQAIVAPAGDAQEGVFVGLPDGAGSHDGGVPGDDEAIRVARDEALIAPDKGGGMNLGLVAAQDGLGLRGLSVRLHGAALDDKI